MMQNQNKAVNSLTEPVWQNKKTHIMPTYGRKEICLVEGKGTYVWDTEGHKYLDFVSGVAVNAFGHCDPVTVACLTEQSGKLMHVSNLYWNEQQLNLAEKLTQLSKGAFTAAFFCNSGTEAVEAALKIARKHGANQDKRKILYFTGSFHGRSTGALTVTSEIKYRTPYLKSEEETVQLPINDIEALEQVDFAEVCAVILEPIQGEGGLTLCHNEFLKKVKKLTVQHDCLLVYDEVQCGIGRTGYFYTAELTGVVPDIVCLAKGLGGGFPIGAILVNDKANILSPGDHGSTFGGNPLACAVANGVVNRLEKEEIMAHIKNASLYMHEKLQVMANAYPGIIDEVRGLGLLLGVKINDNVLVDSVINEARGCGLLLVSASGNVIRLLPPLNVSFEEIDECVVKLSKALETVLLNTK